MGQYEETQGGDEPTRRRVAHPMRFVCLRGSLARNESRCGAVWQLRRRRPLATALSRISAAARKTAGHEAQGGPVRAGARKPNNMRVAATGVPGCPSSEVRWGRLRGSPCERNFHLSDTSLRAWPRMERRMKWSASYRCFRMEWGWYTTEAATGRGPGAHCNKSMSK